MKSSEKTKVGRARRPVPAAERGPEAHETAPVGKDPLPSWAPTSPAARPAGPVAREALEALGGIAGHAGAGGAGPERAHHQRSLEDLLFPGSALLRPHQRPRRGRRARAAQRERQAPHQPRRLLLLAGALPLRRAAAGGVLRAAPLARRGGEGRGAQPGHHREPGGGVGGDRESRPRARRSSWGEATPSSSRPTCRTCTAAGPTRSQSCTWS